MACAASSYQRDAASTFGAAGALIAGVASVDERNMMRGCCGRLAKAVGGLRRARGALHRRAAVLF